MGAALEKSGWRFSCEGSEFTTEEVTASDGLLPMWIHQAQEVMRHAFAGKTGNMDYRLDGAALCGVRPDPQGQSVSLSVWACFVHFAMEDWYKKGIKMVPKGSPVPMDDIYQAWQQVIRARQVSLLPPQPMGQPTPTALQSSTLGTDQRQ